MTSQANPVQLAREFRTRPPPRAWLFDYDGTLVPMAERPEKALLDDDMHDLLHALARRADTRVAIVTGRALTALLSLTGPLSGVTLAVNGGLRIVDEGSDWIHPDVPAALPSLRRAKAVLEELVKRAPGAMVEDKSISLALHYRACPHLKPMLERSTLDALEPDLRLIHGKKVFEIQPRIAWDKGKAAAHLLKRWGVSNSCLFAGDDVIDEPALQAVQACGGLGVRVGDASDDSVAHFRLPDVDAMKALVTAALER